MCTLIKIGRISLELRSVKDGHPCFVLCILNELNIDHVVKPASYQRRKCKRNRNTKKSSVKREKCNHKRKKKENFVFLVLVLRLRLCLCLKSSSFEATKRKRNRKRKI